MTIDMVVTTSVCIALSRLDPAGGQGMRKALVKAFEGMRQPHALLVHIGAGRRNLGNELDLPDPDVDRTIAMLAARRPVALFTIGAVLARSQMGHP